MMTARKGTEMNSLVHSKAARTLAATASLAALLTATPALAQTAAAEPSPNAMVNLIRLLVGQKVITAEAGEALLTQAQSEADAAQAKLAAAVPPPPAPGAVRVPYVPQAVKDEIRDEVRKEVLAQAQSEGWATPGAVPEWVDRIKITGDVRFRSQSNIYADGNANDFIDFASYNQNGPTDLLGSANFNTLPLLNTRQDRMNRLSIRARLGVEAQITKGVEAGLLLASGNNNGPVSVTTLLGGGFAKKDIWLDRAFVRVQPFDQLRLSFGRFENPFITDEILFDEDLNFDGVAARADSGDWLGSGLNLALTGGAFPFEYVGEDNPSTSVGKTRRNGKWIYGGEAALAWDGGDFGARLSAKYFDFSNVRGELSDVCSPYLGEVECSTDHSRPAFLAKGNTLMLLRRLAVDPADPLNSPQPQFVGLLQDYNILEASAEVHADIGEDLRFSLSGTFLKNLAFRRGDACANLPDGLPVTNITGVTVSVPVDPSNPTGSRTNVVNTNPCSSLANSTAVDGGPLVARYESGDTAWMVQAMLGSKALEKAGQWRVGAAYRRIEPDAVLDSLADSDFHLGGTNAQGYIVSGDYMIAKNLRLTGRYLSSNEIYGNPLSIDVLQIDLVAAF